MGFPSASSAGGGVGAVATSEGCGGAVGTNGAGVAVGSLVGSAGGLSAEGGAGSAVVSIGAADSHVLITVGDDGVGFSDPAQVPWSIAARVADAGGTIRVIHDDMPGAHLTVALPEA